MERYTRCKEMIFILTITSFIGAIQGAKMNIHVTLGVKVDPIPGAVIYTSTIPLFFQTPPAPYVVDPEIGVENMCGHNSQGNRYKQHYNKDNGATRTAGQRGCQLSHDAFEALQSNRELLKYLENEDQSPPKPDRLPRDVELSRKERALWEPLGDLLESLTGNPSASTFRQIQSHVAYIEDFAKRLTRLNQAKDTGYIKISRAVSQVTRQTQAGFDNIQNEMRNMSIVFSRLQKEYDDTDMALLNTNMVLADAAQIQRGILTYLWVERSKDVCQNKMIPRLLIPASQLSRELATLRRDLDQKNYKMSVANYDIELYYKLPVADCVWEERKGLIRIQVPVVPQRAEWKLHRIQAIPYQYHNQTCYIDLPSTYVAVNGHQVVPFETQDLSNCQMGEGFLCRLPRYGLKSSRKYRCISKIMQGASIEDLQALCKVECHRDIEPIVTLIAPREYNLANAGENRAVVQCRGETIPLQGPEMGGLSIHLPCACQLIIDSVQVDEDNFPCIAPHIETVLINHTLPVVFTTKYPKVVVAADRPVLLPIDFSLTSVLDPHIDIFNNSEEEFREEELKFSDRLLSPMIMQSTLHESNFLSYLWLISLSCCIGYLFVFYKPVSPHVATIALGPLLPRADARKHFEYAVDCILPTHLEVLLWIYFVWIIVFTTPYVFAFIRRQYTKLMEQREVSRRVKDFATHNPVYRECSQRMDGVNPDETQSLTLDQVGNGAPTANRFLTPTQPSDRGLKTTKPKL